ncbi:hypothetical protein EMGBS15_11100 [Filimonas sp.]|nr:hypothetical protein EMGBS15_11100 [Filimonas sp.]
MSDSPSIFNFGYFFLILCIFITLTLEPTIQIGQQISLLKENTEFSCSLLVGKNYLSYVISDTEYKDLYQLKHYYFENKVLGKNDFNAIFSDPIFHKIRRMKIAIDSSKSTLVPTSLFSQTNQNDYFGLIYNLPFEEELHTQALNDNKTSVFSLKKSTVSFLRSKAGNVTFYDASSCLLNTYPSMLNNEERHTFFVCVKDDCATLSIYHHEALLLHQTYTDITTSDITYHIANFIAVHQLSKEHVSIQLHGESKRLITVSDELNRYFPDVKYCNRVSALKYPDTMLAQPTQYFFNLLSLVTCA